MQGLNAVSNGGGVGAGEREGGGKESVLCVWRGEERREEERRRGEYTRVEKRRGENSESVRRPSTRSIPGTLFDVTCRSHNHRRS